MFIYISIDNWWEEHEMVTMAAVEKVQAELNFQDLVGFWLQLFTSGTSRSVLCDSHPSLDVTVSC